VVVGSFLTELPRRLKRLREALARGDREEVVFVAHSLKGSSGQLGALRLAAVSRELEERGKESRLEGAEEVLVRLEAEMEQAALALREHSEPLAS
jgi:HPt (histidine-containing phosphotransfer) domain-containing protein